MNRTKRERAISVVTAGHVGRAIRRAEEILERKRLFKELRGVGISRSQAKHYSRSINTDQVSTVPQPEITEPKKLELIVTPNA